MTKSRNKAIAFVLALATVLSLCFTLVACTDDNTPDNTDTTAKVEQPMALSASDFKSEIVNTSGVMLLSASPMAAAANSSYIEQTLTATVLPATASNKKVDWSVAWADTSNTANVSDYVTVTPHADGSTTATVTCKAAFSGNIVITATTRQNGYTADCIVSFVGIPANIEIITNLTPASDGYHVAVGNSYTFGTELSNPFGAVGNAYQTLEVSVEGVGQIKVASKEVYVSSGNTKWYDDLAKNIDLNTIASKFIDASIATDGTITVNVKKSIESYYATLERIDGGRTQYYTDCFRDYVTNCYFKIVLTEPKSGVSTSFNLVLDENAVTGVSLASSEMYF